MRHHPHHDPGKRQASLACGHSAQAAQRWPQAPGPPVHHGRNQPAGATATNHCCRPEIRLGSTYLVRPPGPSRTGPNSISQTNSDLSTSQASPARPGPTLGLVNWSGLPGRLGVGCRPTGRCTMSDDWGGRQASPLPHSAERGVRQWSKEATIAGLHPQLRRCEHR